MPRRRETEKIYSSFFSRITPRIRVSSVKSYFATQRPRAIIKITPSTINDPII